MTVRRLIWITVALACVAIVGAAIIGYGGASGAKTGGYEVDAVFDTAKGVLPGVPVTVAGTKVGKVEKIALTRGYKARVRMSVDARFAPFRSDATCLIRPQGVIGESFVACKPGSPSAPELRKGDYGAPLVPLRDTSTPVALTDFFDIWTVPVRQRLTLLLNELGIALAGRGEDLNSLLGRANPALRKAQRVLAVLNRQRRELREGISSSNTVLAELARRRGGLSSLVREASQTFDLTARHRGALAAGIRRLPPLLREVRPSLRDLDVLSSATTPVLSDLRTAAPRLDALLRQVPPFSKVGEPAIERLSPTIGLGARTLRDAGPLARGLRAFTTRADPTGRLLNTLAVSARRAGAFEGILRLFYTYATITSRFDAKGHLFPTAILVNGCSQYVDTEEPECSARYNRSDGSADRSGSRRRPGSARSPSAPRPPVQPGDAAPDAKPAPASRGAERSPARRRPSLPKLPSLRQGKPKPPIEQLLDYLLG